MNPLRSKVDNSRLNTGIFRHKHAGPDDGAIPNVRPWQDDRVETDDGIAANAHALEDQPRDSSECAITVAWPPMTALSPISKRERSAQNFELIWTFSPSLAPIRR